MPPAQRSKTKLPPIDYTEAMAAPAMVGMMSFLTIKPEDVPLPGNETAPGTETDPGNDITPPADIRTATVVVIEQEMEYEKARRRWPGTNGTEPGNETAPGTEMYPGNDITPGRETGPGRVRVREAVTVQDGHSLGEDAVYRVLWRHSKPEGEEKNSSRLVRMGVNEVAAMTNMARKNARANLNRLVEKLAIAVVEEFSAVSNEARLWRVYSYSQILERRRAAGMLYVLRTKGVVFCTAAGVPLSSPGVEKNPGNGITPGHNKTPGDKREISAESVSEPHSQVAKLWNQYGTVDQAAVNKLLSDCWTRRPDATLEEICYFLELRLEVCARNPNIYNPVGLILATVPPCLDGPAFLEFRERRAEEQRQREEAAAYSRQQTESINNWLGKEIDRLKNIVADLEIPEEERLRAQDELRKYNWHPKFKN